MNWYLLNLPLCAAVATAVVAPIMVVISRESTHQDAVQAPGAGLDLVPLAAGTSPAGPATSAPAGQPGRVLVGVS